MHNAEIQPIHIYFHTSFINTGKKIGLSIISVGAFVFLLALTAVAETHSYSLGIIGGMAITLGYGIVLFLQVKESPAGIKNNNIFFKSLTSKGSLGWIAGILITTFYVVLYWFPSGIESWIRLFDPISYTFRGIAADRWFLYGSFYTSAVLLLGGRMLVKYRHNRYQILRTLSVMFFQVVFAFIIPALLHRFNSPEYYFSYFWPLKYNYLFPNDIHWLIKSGGVGYFMVFWGIAMSFVATPILTYYYGKRWYCSWVCGCGGLAETAGDSFRQLSDKSLKAWKIERWTIHSVLVFVVITTALLWINSAYQGTILGPISLKFAEIYGFVIGAVFSGVVGVGFYPLFGNRVWCRFGCPMAAVLGLQQKLKSRFRITTNGGQCISCGNCSTYCEMGIDVRSYAQKGQNIIRSSCVGCGICSAVCPRGVLKLENGPEDGRYNLGK